MARRTDAGHLEGALAILLNTMARDRDARVAASHQAIAQCLKQPDPVAHLVHSFERDVLAGLLEGLTDAQRKRCLEVFRAALGFAPTYDALIEALNDRAGSGADARDPSGVAFRPTVAASLN